MAEVLIRSGSVLDIPTLQFIELACFETLQKHGAVNWPPYNHCEGAYLDFLRKGVLLVASNEKDHPIGFMACQYYDDWLHLEEMNVMPGWQGYGIGRRFLYFSTAIARRKNLQGVTLTTDKTAPFNAPFYGKYGFTEIPLKNMQKHIHQKLHAEKLIGLNPKRRIAMQKPIH